MLTSFTALVNYDTEITRIRAANARAHLVHTLTYIKFMNLCDQIGATSDENEKKLLIDEQNRIIKEQILIRTIPS